MARAFRILAALIVLIGFGWSQAHAQIPLTGAGRGAPGGGTSFTGPLDIVGSASGCFSLRACSAATRGTKAVNVCNSTGGVDVGCADLLTDATTGNLVAATVSSITCPGANCTIKFWYDQTVSGLCGGSCDLLQATVSKRAALTANCINTTLPCATFVSANSQDYAPATGTPLSAQPFTTSHVANHTGAAFSTQAMWGTNSATLLRYSALSGANDISINAGGGAVGAVVSDNAFHSLVIVVNGASSNVTVDGTSNVVNPGTTSGGTLFSLGSESASGATNFLDAKVTEVIMWRSGLTTGVSSQAANVCHNQFTYWGTSVSC